jgi:hypothetical protein
MIKNKTHTARIDLIEIEPELQEIAKQYGTIVDNNFLEFVPNSPYDYIIMNPPFDNGEKHLLMAIQIATNQNSNCTIRCILNAETIRNPYSIQRKQLANLLEHYNATIEYIQNGFSNAERETDVEIAMISVTILNKKENYFDANLEQDSEYFGELNERALQTPNRIENIVQDFQRAKEMYSEGVAQIRRAQEIMKHHT